MPWQQLGQIAPKANQKHLVVDALRGVRANGRIPGDIWTQLSDSLLGAESLIRTMEGPREGRVKAAEITIRELSNGPPETQRCRAFIAGYMTSCIQPGSLDHFSILFPVIAKLRESFLWYGVCSGLTPETSIDNYGNGLGWMMKRELGRPSYWLDRPTCDIALSEMGILLRNREDAGVSIRTIANGVLNAEIFPLISTSIKWQGYGEDRLGERDAWAGNQGMLFDESPGLRTAVLELLHKIEESSMSLDAIRRQVEKTFGEKVPRGRKRWK